MARLLERGVRYSIAVVVFGVGLTLSPTAWVADAPTQTHDLVPVDTLQEPGKSLWRAPAPAGDCESKVKPRKSIWLSPDEPVSPGRYYQARMGHVRC